MYYGDSAPQRTEGKYRNNDQTFADHWNYDDVSEDCLRLNVWTPGLTLVTNLLHDVIARYSVDKNRIYGTGQSQGGMANIAISDKYPDLFAAQWLVACQWNVEEMAAMKDQKLWITVCEGDTKAFPGMNAATALWESLGSKVARNKTFWDSHASMTEINKNVKDLAAANAPINYSVFAGGNHMYTWSFAYDIEAIRDWLFQQRKEDKQGQHSLLAKALQDAGLAAYNAGDYKKALANFTAANSKGHMKAPRYIGLCYEHGYGVKANTALPSGSYTSNVVYTVIAEGNPAAEGKVALDDEATTSDRKSVV